MNEINPELKQAFDFFMNYPDAPERYQAKLAELQRSPLNNLFSRYQAFLDKLPERMPRVADCAEPPRTEIVVRKTSILKVFRFFEGSGCRNVKICFGMDECHNLQMVISGSFQVSADTDPSPEHVDRLYSKILTVKGKKRTKTRYYLNFEKISPTGKISEYLNRYHEAIAPQALHGYALDMVTLRHFLESKEYLGKAKSIKFRFGMNSSGNSGLNVGNARIMMIAIGAADDSLSCTLYLCDTAIKNNSDPTLCPPRKPCDAK